MVFHVTSPYTLLNLKVMCDNVGGGCYTALVYIYNEGKGHHIFLLVFSCNQNGKARR